ncbi:MAG: hypothetical protein ACI9HY_000590 [Planctomycetaceae bacterium]|jgi:hypothetical protein
MNGDCVTFPTPALQMCLHPGNGSSTREPFRPVNTPRRTRAVHPVEADHCLFPTRFSSSQVAIVQSTASTELFLSRLCCGHGLVVTRTRTGGQSRSDGDFRDYPNSFGNCHQHAAVRGDPNRLATTSWRSLKKD